MKRKHIQVSLSPLLYKTMRMENSIVVVIDILRATTCMCVGIDNNAECIVPVETIDECASFKSRGYLCAAERDGEMIPGFDMGNSPFSFMQPEIIGKKIAMTTTNGTQAIHAARNALQIVIGSFANLTILRDWLIEQNQHIILLCSGWKNNVNLEDTIFAGALVEELAPYFDLKDDAATMARCLYQAADNDKRHYLQMSSHYLRLMDLNLQQDVKYCLHKDNHPVVPIYQNGAIRNALKPQVVSRVLRASSF